MLKQDQNLHVLKKPAASSWFKVKNNIFTARYPKSHKVTLKKNKQQSIAAFFWLTVFAGD